MIGVKMILWEAQRLKMCFQTIKMKKNFQKRCKINIQSTLYIGESRKKDFNEEVEKIKQ